MSVASTVDPKSGARGIPRLRSGHIPLLSYGFRPFFLGAGLWACVAMALWICLLSGRLSFAGGYGALAWHAHELLFGYVSAVLTGFLLTAVPNWTGRLPLQGRPLLALVTLWLAGRAAMLMTGLVGNIAAASADAAYLFVVAAVMAREIAAGKNWRNLKVIALVTLLATANVVFHAEVILAGAPAYGMRLGIGAIVMMIVLIGGRITPSFTGNWLARQGTAKRPAPLGRVDIFAIGATAIAVVSWVALPEWQGTGVLLLAAALGQAVRLSRWAGLQAWREPIVLILHAGYAFVPLGALTLAVSILWPALLPQTGALHAWTTGAIGVMTLAVMTRATRGHTGRAIEAPVSTRAIYAAIVLAALTRTAAPILPTLYMETLYLSAALWFAAFAGFAACYGPMLVTARRSGNIGC